MGSRKSKELIVILEILKQSSKEVETDVLSGQVSLLLVKRRNSSMGSSYDNPNSCPANFARWSEFTIRNQRLALVTALREAVGSSL